MIYGSLKIDKAILRTTAQIYEIMVADMFWNYKIMSQKGYVTLAQRCINKYSKHGTSLLRTELFVQLCTKIYDDI